MPFWAGTIDVSHIWSSTIPFSEKRDGVVAAIMGSQWYLDQVAEGGPIVAIVDDLSTANTISEFNEWWNELYDFADLDRIWIATF